MLSKIISNRSFVDFHKKPEHILEDFCRILFKASLHDLFWGNMRLNNYFFQFFCMGKFFLKKFVHHWNCRSTKWSLQTNVSDVRNINVLLEKLNVLDDLIVNIGNVCVSTFWAQPVNSFSVSERSRIQNRVSKASSRSHDPQSLLFIQLISIERYKVTIWNKQQAIRVCLEIIHKLETWNVKSFL